MENKDYMPLLYFIMGIGFLLMFGFMVFVSIMASAAPIPQTYLLFAMTVMTFSLSYLYPHLKQKDERAKMIRQKGMFYSYFALMIYYAALTIIIQYEIFSLSAMEVLNILVALTICTVFISWVILANEINTNREGSSIIFILSAIILVGTLYLITRKHYDKKKGLSKKGFIIIISSIFIYFAVFAILGLLAGR